MTEQLTEQLTEQNHHAIDDWREQKAELIKAMEKRGLPCFMCPPSIVEQCPSTILRTGKTICELAEEGE